MKHLILSSLLAFSFLASAADHTPSTFHLRPFETQTLKNGLTIIWISDNTLPYLSMEMMLKAGSAQDPDGKAGVADLTATMLKKGSKGRSATQISDELDQLGAQIGVGADVDYSSVVMSTLSFHKDEAFKIYSDIIMQPTFTNSELERLRKHSLGVLMSLADQAESFASYIFPQFIYGDEHPYGHEPSGTIHSVKGIKRIDIQHFYENEYVPENAILAVVGQYDDAFKVQVAKAFESWKSGAPKHKTIPAFPKIEGREILLVDRADLQQAQVLLAGKGVKRDMPTLDYLAVRAALKILGESFGSRLFDDIRVKHALTYGINAWFDPREGVGPIGISTFTRVEKTGEIIRETLKTYEHFVKDGVTDSEVVTVKALMRGQFARMFETPEALGHQLLVLKRYGIPTEYLTQNLENVDRLTRDQINDTIKRYFDPKDMRILVYAPKKVEPELEKIGKVTVKPYKVFLQ